MVEDNLLSSIFTRVPLQQPFLMIVDGGLTIRCRLCNDLVYFALRFAHEVLPSKTIVVDNPLYSNGSVGEEAHGPGVASLHRLPRSPQGFSSGGDGRMVSDLLNGCPTS